MSARRVTLSDVAARVGLSKAAVSQVLNSHPASRVSVDAAARIRAAAGELGYRPNLTARSLTTRRSGVIGLVSEAITTDRFGSGMIRGALAEAKRQGYVLFITETEDQQAGIVSSFGVLVDHQVDGLIYASIRPHAVELPEINADIPVVMLNAVASRPTATVLADEHAGGESIVRLLLDAGHTEDVVIIGRDRSVRPDWTTRAIERRLAGISAALAAHDVVPISEIDMPEWDPDHGYEAMRGLLASGRRPGAVIALNDRLAFGVYRALTEAGLRVSEDVSVVSFDDDDIALYLEPTLTTAALPYEEMGALAVRTLLDPDLTVGEQLVPMPIRVRGSVSAVPQALQSFDRPH